MKIFLTLLTLPLLVGCSKVGDNMDKWKNEIMETELAFCEMAEAEGIPVAFIHYAADDAVILRSEKLIEGKQAIADFYKHNKDKYANVKLIWKPTLIDVAASGDLAYTYGKYVFISKDLSENEVKNEGVFHTVWKRQADGSWKFVWD